MSALLLLLGLGFGALLIDDSARVTSASEVQPIAGTVLDLPGDASRVQASDDALHPLPIGEAAAVAAPPLQADAPELVVEGMRLRVARLGIDVPLLLGDMARDTVLGATPEDAAFLLPTSAPPGHGGNSYVYAHARAGMFLSLWQVRLGDLVEVMTPSSELRRYVVMEIHPRVDPTDMRHTLPTVDERITLQTSTGPSGADPRFVVVAVRVP